MFGFCALGAGAVKECGALGHAHEMRNSKGSWGLAGACAQTVRDHPGRQCAGERGSWETVWRRTKIRPPSFRTSFTSLICQVWTVALTLGHFLQEAVRGFP